MWRASVLSIFPDMFPGPLGQSLAGKALAAGAWALDIGQQYREQPDQRQERADPVDELDAGPIGDLAKHGGADAAEAERNSEEQSRHHADTPGHQLLAVHDDGGKRRRQHQTDNDAERDRRG